MLAEKIDFGKYVTVESYGGIAFWVDDWAKEVKEEYFEFPKSKPKSVIVKSPEPFCKNSEKIKRIKIQERINGIFKNSGICACLES